MSIANGVSWQEVLEPLRASEHDFRALFSVFEGRWPLRQLEMASFEGEVDGFWMVFPMVLRVRAQFWRVELFRGFISSQWVFLFLFFISFTEFAAPEHLKDLLWSSKSLQKGLWIQ